MIGTAILHAATMLKRRIQELASNFLLLGILGIRAVKDRQMMRLRLFSLCFILSIALGGAKTAFSQAKEPATKKPWTVNDIVMQESARSWTLSDDGKQALWVKSKPDKKKDKPIATLMITDIASGKHRALTVGQEGINSVKFVPGGKSVSFSTGRKFPDGIKGPKKGSKGAQIWTLDLAGGEARPITAISTGVSGYHWLDDQTLFLSTRERRSRLEEAAKVAKDDTIVVEDETLFTHRRRRLFKFDVKSKKLTRLTDSQEPLGSFATSPDGKWAICRYNRSPHFGAENDIPPGIILHDLANETSVELFATLKSKPGGFVWTKDSKRIYALTPRMTVDGEDSAAITVLTELTIDGLSLRELDLGHDWGISGGFLATDDGYVASLANGVAPFQKVYTRLADGTFRAARLKGANMGRVFGLVKAKNSDRVIYSTGSASEPDKVMTARLVDGELIEAKLLYHPNKGFEKKHIAKTEIRKWKGALGEEIEGIVYYPHDYEEGKRYPLVLITHGGPHGADRDRFSERWANSPNLYCQRGAFVLKTNYHGSSDYGLAFGEAIKRKYYELEVIDMFSGIKMLEDEGKIDRKRMGVIGWSNGAILSIASVALAHRFAPGFDYTFKVCAPGAGDVNWTSDYGNCRFGASFDEFYLGGTPWTNLEGYIAKSALYEVERVTTPTIIFFGTQDTAVPTEQGWEWFRALNRVGKAPVRFLLFPGQPHGLRKVTHQRRKLTEELAWVDRYLFDKKEAEDLTVKKGSPLDIALSATKFACYGAHYGKRESGILVPETVPWKNGVEIGRFEVTHAQWHSFKSEALPSTLPNYPINGVSIEDAMGYVSFLKEKTGRAWRFISEKEFEALSALKGASENTLNYWAGYKPSETDAEVLRTKMMTQHSANWLMRVGSRPPGSKGKGQDRVLFYDLGGNVAEWVLSKSEGFVIRGAWALASPDSRSKVQVAPLMWAGLRLAVGPLPANK